MEVFALGLVVLLIFAVIAAYLWSLARGEAERQAMAERWQLTLASQRASELAATEERTRKTERSTAMAKVFRRLREVPKKSEEERELLALLSTLDPSYDELRQELSYSHPRAPDIRAALSARLNELLTDEVRRVV